MYITNNVLQFSYSFSRKKMDPMISVPDYLISVVFANQKRISNKPYEMRFDKGNVKEKRK